MMTDLCNIFLSQFVEAEVSSDEDQNLENENDQATDEIYRDFIISFLPSKKLKLTELVQINWGRESDDKTPSETN